MLRWNPRTLRQYPRDIQVELPREDDVAPVRDRRSRGGDERQLRVRRAEAPVRSNRHRLQRVGVRGEVPTPRNPDCLGCMECGAKNA